MIKIMQNYDMEKLEKEVNEYIENCGSKISGITFDITDYPDMGVIITCFIVHDLDFINSYK